MPSLDAIRWILYAALFSWQTTFLALLASSGEPFGVMSSEWSYLINDMFYAILLLPRTGAALTVRYLLTPLLFSHNLVWSCASVVLAFLVPTELLTEGGLSRATIGSPGSSLGFPMVVLMANVFNHLCPLIVSSAELWIERKRIRRLLVSILRYLGARCTAAVFMIAYSIAPAVPLGIYGLGAEISSIYHVDDGLVFCIRLAEGVCVSLFSLQQALLMAYLSGMLPPKARRRAPRTGR
jgi:hypothetical protein